MKNVLFVCLSLFLFSACSSISYVNIETYKPAEITFPLATSKVLIVNNAVPQPDHAGYQYILKGVEQDTARAKADSALFDACRSLGVAMMETGYFNDILLYHEATRKDNVYLKDERLSPETVKTLCEENDVEAIISFDRLLFETKKVITEVTSMFYIGVVQVRTNGVLRVYLPDRPSPLATVLMNDSVYWAEEAESIAALQHYLPTPEQALRETGKFLGEIALPNFVPHWQNEIRWFYTGGTTDWKLATAYANTQRWEMALQRWESIYNNTSGETAKAKSASNIAFAHEMLGSYDKALGWAEKALPLFRKKGEDTKDYQLLFQYTVVLRERIRENQKLNIQLN